MPAWEKKARNADLEGVEGWLEAWGCAPASGAAERFPLGRGDPRAALGWGDLLQNPCVRPWWGEAGHVGRACSPKISSYRVGSPGQRRERARSGAGSRHQRGEQGKASQVHQMGSCLDQAAEGWISVEDFLFSPFLKAASPLNRASFCTHASERRRAHLSPLLQCCSLWCEASWLLGRVRGQGQAPVGAMVNSRGYWIGSTSSVALGPCLPAGGAVFVGLMDLCTFWRSEPGSGR